MGNLASRGCQRSGLVTNILQWLCTHFEYLMHHGSTRMQCTWAWHTLCATERGWTNGRQTSHILLCSRTHPLVLSGFTYKTKVQRYNTKNFKVGTESINQTWGSSEHETLCWKPMKPVLLSRDAHNTLIKTNKQTLSSWSSALCTKSSYSPGSTHCTLWLIWKDLKGK
jgi:hypothetical protein